MQAIDILRMRIRMLFHRGRAGAELDMELQAHLEREVEENLAAGLSVKDARLAALRSFGNPALFRDQTRANWSWSGLESVMRDLRIALGAQRSEVLGRMLIDGVRPALYGMIAGLAVSAGLVHAIESMLYQTPPLDPMVFAGVGGLLLLVSLAACIAPAWRASRLDPIVALRAE